MLEKAAGKVFATMIILVCNLVMIKEFIVIVSKFLSCILKKTSQNRRLTNHRP